MSSLFEQSLVCYSIAESTWEYASVNTKYINTTCFNLHHCMEYCLEFLLELSGHRPSYECDLCKHITTLISYGVTTPILNRINSLADLYYTWGMEFYLPDDSKSIDSEVSNGFKVCSELLTSVWNMLTPCKGTECLEELNMRWLEFCDKCRFHYPVKPSCSDIDTFDISLVYPLQQDNVRNVYLAVKDMDFVKSVWVFGSSVTFKCTEYSDLDLCIEMQPNATNKQCNDVASSVYSACDCNVDIIWFDHISRRDGVYLDIMKGLKIK